MNNHSEENQIALYLDKRLPETDIQHFERHLESCDSCRMEMISQQEIKLRMAKMVRHPAPNRLISNLRKQHEGVRWVEKWKTWLFPVHFGWKPVGALTLVSAVFTFWIFSRSAENDSAVDLDYLIAYHNRYQAESLLPPADMVASRFSSHVVVRQK